MIKLAFIGAAGAGKDYVASKIRNSFNGKSVRYAFADELKKDVIRICGLGQDELKLMIESEDYKQGMYYRFSDSKLMKGPGKGYRIITSTIKEQPQENDIMQLREFLVYYGTYVMRKYLGGNIWINRLFNSIRDADLITITDLRFPEEYKKCKKEGFKIILVRNIDQPGKLIPDNIAESYYEKFEPDYTFENTYDENRFKKELTKFYTYVDNNLSDRVSPSIN